MKAEIIIQKNVLFHFHDFYHLYLVNNQYLIAYKEPLDLECRLKKTAAHSLLCSFSLKNTVIDEANRNYIFKKC